MTYPKLPIKEDKCPQRKRYLSFLYIWMEVSCDFSSWCNEAIKNTGDIILNLFAL